MLSYISTHLVETPIRTLDMRKNKFKLYGSLSALLALMMAVTVGFAQYVNAQKEQAILPVSAEEYPGARVFSDYFCTEDTCSAVIGNIIVYRDDNHITTEYMKTLAPVLKIPLQEAFDKLDNGTW